MARRDQRGAFNDKFGSVPPVWVGRDEVFADMDVSLMKSREEGRRNLLLSGPKGLGKTALLREWQQRARRSGWRAVMVTPGPGDLQADLLSEIEDEQPLRVRAFRRVTTSLRLGPLSVSAARDAPARSILVREMAKLAKRSRRGVLFLVDEAHALEAAELRAFGRAYQQSEGKASRKNFAVVLAGLASVADKVSTVEETTFFQRLVERPLGMLHDHEVKRYVRQSLARLDKQITEDALDLVVRESAGWPHVMQLLRYHAVAEAGEDDLITAAHVRQAQAKARVLAGNHLLAIPWRDLSAEAQDLLTDFAANGDPIVRPSEFVEGRDGSLSVFRHQVQRMVEAGFLTRLSRDEYAFALPFTREWILTKAGLTGDNGEDATTEVNRARDSI